VRAALKSGSHVGALHLGPRPTFQGSPPTIEIHLLDFDADIYGEEVRVDFLQHLREIRPFGTVAALVDQIRDDVEAARDAVQAVDADGRRT
jgi:riboflavin kinase/FMN adenylyltransferase